jgi:hypothetical protein
MSKNIYDYLQEKEEEKEEHIKSVAAYITYCKAKYQNELNKKIRESFTKSDAHFQKCRFNKRSEGHILLMDVFTSEILQKHQYMEINSITLARTPIIVKGIKVAIHVYLIVNIEDAIKKEEMDEHKNKESYLYTDGRYTQEFHRILSKKYADKERVSLIIERHERVGIEYYFQRLEDQQETDFLTIDFSMSYKLQEIQAYMKNFLPPTKILENFPSFPSFPFKIILGEFINNAIIYYTMNLSGRMPYGMGLLTFWSKYSLAQNNCQLFAFSCLHANFLLPTEDEIHFLRDIVTEKQTQLEKYCTRLYTFYEANAISLLGLVPNKAIVLYGGPTSGKKSSNMLYMNSTFVIADADDKKCIKECYESTPECLETCHIDMCIKVECTISKALLILYTNSLEILKNSIKPPYTQEKFNTLLENRADYIKHKKLSKIKENLDKHIKILEDTAFTVALKNCNSIKEKLSEYFNTLKISDNLSFFKKYKNHHFL